MKKILLWDPRFPERSPLPIVVSNAIATAIAADGTGAVLPEVVLGIARIGGDVGVLPDLPTIALAITPASQAEGSSGATAYTYTATLGRNGSTAAVPFVWSVAGNGANPANAADFGGAFPGGSGTFAPGETIKTGTILVTGDQTVELDESFLMTFVATGVGTATANGTIVNDDVAAPGTPTISFANPTATVAEGNSGTAAVASTVSVERNGVTGALVVNLTYGGTATSGTDYASGPGSVTIPDGATSISFDLLVSGDVVVESDETIIVSAQLAAYSSATATKTITVTNDDVSSFAAPPADWRMPSTASYSSIAAAATQMQTAQAAANSKDRPSFSATAATHWYAYDVPASTTDLIMSWYHQRSTTNSKVEQSTDSTNGQDGAWTTVWDGANAFLGDRDAALIPASNVRRMVRLTTTTGSSGTFGILLHKKPATGPWDCVQIHGGSREGTGLGTGIEAAVIAGFPGRDPIVINKAQSGATISGETERADLYGPRTVGIVCYNYIGSPAGNDVTGERPYAPAQQATYKTRYDNLINVIKKYQPDASRILLDDISFRYYPASQPPEVIAETQAGRDNGSGPYNRNAIWDRIQTHTPHAFDADLQVGTMGDYFYQFAYRLNLATADGVHENYINTRANKAVVVWGYFYTGVWEQHYVRKMVAKAEATGLGWDIMNARYAVEELPATSAKTALQNRLNALSAAPLQTIAITPGGATTARGFVGFDGTVAGVVSASILNRAGVASGIQLSVLDPFTTLRAGTSTAVGTGLTWNTDFLLTLGAENTAAADTAVLEFANLNPGRKYQLVMIGAVAFVSTSTTRKTIFSVNGVDSPAIESQSNRADVHQTGKISPDANGKITVVVKTGNASRSYLNNLMLEEFAA